MMIREGREGTRRGETRRQGEQGQPEDDPRRHAKAREGRSWHITRGAGRWAERRRRRADRTPERAAGSYYWASAIPPSYAARKRSDSLRLADAAAVWQYIAQQEGE